MAHAKVRLPAAIVERLDAVAPSQEERTRLVQSAIEGILNAAHELRFASMKRAVPLMQGPAASLEFDIDDGVARRLQAFVTRAQLRPEVLLAGALLLALDDAGIPPGGPHGRRGPRHPDAGAPPSDDDPRTADELERFADAPDVDVDERSAALERCVALRERELGPTHATVLFTRHKLGLSRLTSARPDLAIGPFEEVLHAVDAEPRPAFDRIDQLLAALAVCYRMTGRMDEADACWRRAVDRVRSGAVPADDGTAADVLAGYANFLGHARRFDEAIGCVDEALRIAGTGGAGATEGVLKAHYLGSALAAAMGDLEGAERRFREYLRACGADGSLPMGRPFARPGA